MKNINRLWKKRLLLALIALIFISSNLGCMSSQVSPPISISTEPKPTTVQTVVLNQTKPEKTFLPSPTTAPPPKPSANELHDPTPTEPSHADVVWDMLGQVNIDRALNDLKMLSGEEPICTDKGCYTIKNRQTGSKGLSWAKDYIEQELTKLGYSVRRQDWSNLKWTDQNLIARKPGALHPEEEIYFVAHVDGVKELLKDRFPAADDNASGVVDLLEMARIISSYSFSRTVVILFTTGEEHGTLGVQNYINQLSQDELSSIKYVVDVDMVGYDANQDKVMEFWHGGDPPSKELTNQMSEIIKDYRLELAPVFVVGCG